MIPSWCAQLMSPCLLKHSDEWTRVIVDGVWMKACARCLTPTAVILGDRGKALEDIQPAKVPPIVVRHAVKAKKPRTSKALKYPRKLA